jgi:hypothetical protein
MGDRQGGGAIALGILEKNGKVRPELARKIWQDNPARFYGIR